MAIKMVSAWRRQLLRMTAGQQACAEWELLATTHILQFYSDILLFADTRARPEASTSGRKSESDDAAFGQLPFSMRNATMLHAIPKFCTYSSCTRLGQLTGHLREGHPVFCGADGLVQLDGSLLLELEDVAREYRHPSIVDIKVWALAWFASESRLSTGLTASVAQVGLKTWYAWADPRHIERCKLKDAATTQATLGFKICGMQARLLFWPILCTI